MSEENGEMQKVIGYGTFITHGVYKEKENVQPVIVKGYRRVFEKRRMRYPFVLEDQESSFVGLSFDIQKDYLRGLDSYECCDRQDPNNSNGNGLYYRKEINAETTDGVEITAWIYIPTNRTIKRGRLSLDIDDKDSWREIIKVHCDGMKDFPVLVQ